MSTMTTSSTSAASGGVWQKLVATTNDPGALVARLALGIVMFPHGAQKVLGWFGGYGLQGTLGFFTQGMHIPLPLAILAIAAEFLGSLGLVVGLLGRVAAFGILVNMLVAIATVHLHNGFFMNWAGTQHGEGFEYHLLAIGLALVVLLKGSGAVSFDRMFTKETR